MTYAELKRGSQYRQILAERLAGIVREAARAERQRTLAVWDAFVLGRDAELRQQDREGFADVRHSDAIQVGHSSIEEKESIAA